MIIDQPIEYYLILGAAVAFLSPCLFLAAFRPDEDDPNRGYHAGPYCG